MLPLTWLTLGKLLATRGESTAALEAVDNAESAAAKLEMRPIVWQSRLTAAGILESLSDEEAARAKRAGARVVVEEIAGLLQDDTLRTAYLESARKKVGG